MLRIAPAVAQAAMESGVARRPIADFDAYADRLGRFVFRSGFMMKPIFAKARGGAEARHLFRGRGRARAARDAGRARGAARAADPDRPARGDRGAPQALRPGASTPGVDFEVDRSPQTIRAIATMSRLISRSPDARA